MAHYTTEAVVVGIVTVLIGLSVSFTIINLKGTKNKYPQTKDWFWMAVGLFFTGFVAHLIFEVMKWNLWYCTHGYACRNQ